jgi:quercetin dioxygenase-like cupin family protein
VSAHQPTQGGSAPVPLVRPAGEAPACPVAAGRNTSVQVLVGPEDGAPNYVLRRFRMEVGGGIPTHTNEVEHEQYVLRGRARIRIGDAVHDVGADDALFIPAGVPHSYDVTEGPFEFLCIVPNAPDRIMLQEPGC